MLDLSICLLISSMQGPVYDPGLVRPEDGPTPAAIEVSRIQRHLSHVEATLRANPPAGLSPQQLGARERSLDALHAYWQAGEFPKNLDFHDRRIPYFIDAEGTACAVGQLMIESGDDALAREIASYENNDFVAQIEHPGVPDWLERNGFAAWEAAWIQPSYGPCGFGELPLVCGTDGNTYLCESVAVECAGVEVAHEGACGTDTEGGSTDTGGTGPVIGEEVCVAMGSSTGDTNTTGGNMSTSSGPDTSGGSTAGDSDGTAGPIDATGGTPTGGDGSSGTEERADEDDKGCSCRAGGTTSPTAVALGLLGLWGLRRRRHG